MLDLEIQKKINAIELAKQIQNVAEATRRSGMSRQTIHRNQKILKKQGSQALKRTFRKDHYPKNRTAKNRQIIKFSLKNPHFGQAQASLQMKKNEPNGQIKYENYLPENLLVGRLLRQSRSVINPTVSLGNDTFTIYLTTVSLEFLRHEYGVLTIHYSAQDPHRAE
jgi:hypothetical protein